MWKSLAAAKFGSASGCPQSLTSWMHAGWLATVKAPGSTFQGIFSGEIGAAVRRVQAGDAAPADAGEPA